jgi:hypothetical protein
MIVSLLLLLKKRKDEMNVKEMKEKESKKKIIVGRN